MLEVVPGKKRAAESAGVLDAAEAVGEVRPVLERLELRFRERVVVGDVWPAECVLVTPRSASSNATGLERIDEPRSACSVSWPGLDVLLRARLRDEPLGERRRFLRRRPSSHGVAAEDVEDHVQVEVRPLRRSEQLRDVPGPQLVRAVASSSGLVIAGWVADRAAHVPRDSLRARDTSCAPSTGNVPSSSSVA